MSLHISVHLRRDQGQGKSRVIVPITYQPLLVPNTRLHQLLIAGVLTLDLIQLGEENIQRKVLCKFKLTEIKAFNFYVRKVLIISGLELAVN